jgi:eukaryotic-like serine/threonine-protein kinase
MIDCHLGHYHVLEKIGEGGMGEVFLAHDEHLGHDVALKVLPPETDDHSRHLFRKEAHALSGLNHPNIVTVLDFDTQENLDFLVMEYVPGLALDEKVRKGALPEKDIVHIGVQLAEGLAAAHEQGVIHRDLKPGNLRLTKDDRLKILDFGLARSTLRLSPIATTVSCDGPADCSGTLPYMSTEQLLGHAVDERTDIYSAGAVLYELCTGHPPFEQPLFPALVDDILHKVPASLSSSRPGISPRLEAIIQRCLEKDPAKRYQSARDLGLDLQELANAWAEGSAVFPFKKVKRYSFYGLAVCVALVLLVALGTNARRWMDPLRIRGKPQIESLAVLPFANLSGDSQQEYLADGMTDFLITDLGQIHTLQRIISRTSIMHYKTDHQPLREIARQLNVDAVIEGSVLRSDKTLQVTVRLVSTRDDRQLWSRSYESEFRDLLSLQHELALAIASEIKVNLTAGERARLAAVHPVDPAAQEAYLRANYLSTGTGQQRAKARQYYEVAVRLAQDYAPAYAGLSDSYWGTVDMPTRETMPKAKEYALKAIALDDTLAHGHTALASVLFYGDWDWQGADREFQRALDLNRNDADAHRMYSVYLTAMGRVDEALKQIQEARRLDPLSVYVASTGGWNLYCSRRYDQAVELCGKVIELAPNSDSSHACLSYVYLGEGKFAPALEEGRRAWDLSGGDTVRTVLLGQTLAAAGYKNEARKLLDLLLEQSRQNYVPPYFVAVLAAALGDRERAFQYLEEGRRQRDLYLAWLKVDPAVDSLRSDARFQTLLRDVGLAR